MNEGLRLYRRYRRPGTPYQESSPSHWISGCFLR